MHVGMEFAEMLLRPSEELIECWSQCRSSFGQLVGVAAGSSLWVNPFDEIEPGKQLEAGRENVGRNAFRRFAKV